MRPKSAHYIGMGQFEDTFCIRLMTIWRPYLYNNVQPHHSIGPTKICTSLYRAHDILRCQSFLLMKKTYLFLSCCLFRFLSSFLLPFFTFIVIFLIIFIICINLFFLLLFFLFILLFLFNLGWNDARLKTQIQENWKKKSRKKYLHKTLI